MKVPGLLAAVVVVGLARCACGAGERDAILDRCMQTSERLTPVAQAGGFGTLDKCAALGNGNLMVTIAGSPDDLRFFLGKTDFWMDKVNPAAFQSANVLPGYLRLRMSSMAGAAVRQSVDMRLAEVRTTLTRGADVIAIRSVTPHEADNFLINDIANNGARPIEVRIETCAEQHKNSAWVFDVLAGMDERAGIGYATRKTPSPQPHDEFGSREFRMCSAVATRVLGASCKFEADNAVDRPAGKLAVSCSQCFTLAPGQAVSVITRVHSTGVPITMNPPEALPQAVASLSGLDANAVAALVAAHRGWWGEFWSRSSVRLDAEPVIERAWYGGLYIFGCANRVGQWPAGCNGWPVDDNVPWGGDYHWNYNNQAVYYHACSSNHIDLMEPYHRTLNEANVFGRRRAQSLHAPGTLFCIATAPGHLNEPADIGQKTHAVEAALNLINEYYYGNDPSWAANYPFLRDVADYWDWDLQNHKQTFPNGNYRYVITDSGPMEGAAHDRFNGITGLAFLGRFYRAMIDITLELNERGGFLTERGDADIARWKDILLHLSDYPMSFAYGRKVFAWSEQSLNPLLTEQDWILYPVFPADDVTLSSDPALLEVARNTLIIKPQYYVEWMNNTTQIFSIAARLGHHPPETIERLRTFYNGASPLGINNFKCGGGNTEDVAIVEAIDSFLLQSHEGFLRLFPCWHHPDAQFSTLRAAGAFLVSAAKRNGVCQPVDVFGEAGRPCSILNPWPGRTLAVKDAAGKSLSVAVDNRPYGQVCTFATESGGRYTIATKEPLPAAQPYYNAALYKPVTVSSSHVPPNEKQNWDASKLTDGTRINTRAGHRGWSSALHDEPNHAEWVRIDLGQASPVNRIDLWPLDHGDAWQHTHCTEPFVNSREIDQSYDGFPWDFGIFVSEDGVKWDAVASRDKYLPPAIFPDQSDQKSRDVTGPERFAFTARPVRYVKIQSTKLRKTRYFGKYAMQLAEIEVIRSDAPTAP